MQDQSAAMPLRNEIIMERSVSTQVRPRMDALKREALELELTIKQLQVNTYAHTAGIYVELVNHN